MSESGQTERDDEALMRALAEGREDAFEALMERWADPLRAFLVRLVLNRADAEDLAQETFVRIYKNRGAFRPGARFSTWLFQIALNLARDHARKRVRRKTGSLEELPPDGGNIPADGAPGPRAEAVGREEREAVRAALTRLPEELREVVVLFEYEGKTQAEIAAIAGCSPKAVEMRLRRARARLRADLARWLGR